MATNWILLTNKEYHPPEPTKNKDSLLLTKIKEEAIPSLETHTEA
jgi:hypothetical protein